MSNSFNACLVAVAALLSTGCVTPQAAPSRLDPSAAPPVEEAAMTRDADLLEDRIRLNGSLYGDAALDSYVQAVADRLVANPSPASSGLKIRVRVQGYRGPYADSLPNGAVYLSVGLIARLENEAQLAAVIGSELARFIDRSDLQEQRQGRARNVNSFFPSLLWITATGGLGALNLPAWEAKASDGYALELQGQADARALDFMAAAGYPLDAAPAAYGRLATLMTEEDPRLGGRFGDPERLKAREVTVRFDRLQRYPTDTGGDLRRAPYAEHACTLLLHLASAEVNDWDPKAARRLLSRRDAECGADGRSKYLEAEMARKALPPGGDLVPLVALYQAATRHDDVPPSAFKELGFLYRRQGDTADAKTAFAEYLTRAPEAVDAPIVKSYLEN